MRQTLHFKSSANKLHIKCPSISEGQLVGYPLIGAQIGVVAKLLIYSNINTIDNIY